MTDFVVPSGASVGSVPAVPDELASNLLDTAILTDALKIEAIKQDIAKQLNDGSAGPKFVDLSSRIAGVQIETSAQGASLVVISLIDPAWVIPMSGFIQVDDGGYLWPPIDINFPRGSDCFWRLCQYQAVWDAEMDASQGNVTLTFEDRIVSQLREMSPAYPGGISQGQPNQTLGGFIKQLVDNANHNLKTNIRLVELISPQDPNYTVPINNIPSSAQAPLNRQDPLKQNKGPTAAQSDQVDVAVKAVAKLFSAAVGEPLSIAQVEANAGAISIPSGFGFNNGSNAGFGAVP